jgi:hypothetical protein
MTPARHPKQAAYGEQVREVLCGPPLPTGRQIYMQLSELSIITREDEGAKCRRVSQIETTAPPALDLQAAALQPSGKALNLLRLSIPPLQVEASENFVSHRTSFYADFEGFFDRVLWLCRKNCC